MMDLNNRLNEDETLDQAYDIFLELAGDNLNPSDIVLFNLQFEELGAAELFTPSEDWQQYINFDINPEFFAEVIIGLTNGPSDNISNVFARILICREKTQKFCHILWKE